jgi:hypothetical protein
MLDFWHNQIFNNPNSEFTTALKKKTRINIATVVKIRLLLLFETSCDKFM